MITSDSAAAVAGSTTRSPSDSAFALLFEPSAESLDCVNFG